jgi:predicted AAA+ superfamily ATPase
MYRRWIKPAVNDALSDTPVVFLAGARQTGKSTLVQEIAGENGRTRYVTMDDSTLLAAARHDPQGFIDGLDGRVVLDEVQRVPGLMLAIKAAVDRNRQPGRFLLTGSANVLAAWDRE